jgi:hypothetical protein
LCASLALAGISWGVGGIQHEKVAHDFLTQHGLADKKPGEIDFETVLAQHYVHGRFGMFEVQFPVAGLEKRGGDFRDCAAALLAVQEKLLDWDKPSGRDQKALRADLKAVADWVKGWRPGALAKVHEVGGKDVTAALNAPDTVVAASQRLSQSMGKGEALGLSRESPLCLRMLLAPTRKEFVELAAFIGWSNPEFQATYWVDSVADWSTCWIQDLQVIALEYSTAGHQPDDYASGESMNERDPTVMQQQVVQFSVQRMFEQLFGEQVPSAFIGGLAMNLVIDQFGEINTRVDGDMRARLAPRREVFIPGGQSNGGFLPKNSAETRWREDHGRDHFARMLHLAQKEGEGLDKTLKNRVAGFGVRSDKGGSLAPVRAPFLGAAAAASQGPPDEFQGDFAEMLRGYKCGFIWWLQTKSMGAEKGSKEKFAQLLEKLADPKLEFEAAFTGVYENAPLSDVEAGKESLEGKFLVWLSHQK